MRAGIVGMAALLALAAGAGSCAAGGRTGRCLIKNNKIRWLD